MRKNLGSIILAGALLASSGNALAATPRQAAPRWGIRPERSAPLSPLDLARWMARQLIEVVGIPEPEPIDPESGQGTEPPPVSPDNVCPPERVHCPVG